MMKKYYHDELSNYVHLEKLETLTNIIVSKNLNYLKDDIYKLLKKKLIKKG